MEERSKLILCTKVTENNGSTLLPFPNKTNIRINCVGVNHNDISLVIKKLDSNKAHGSDNTSVKMIQIFGESITLPVKLSFETALKNKECSNKWKWTYVVPVQNRKKIVKKLSSYQLTSYFRNIFKRGIHNSFLVIFFSNKLFTPLQLGFPPGDSFPSCWCERYVLRHSQTFDKVCHNRFLYKLKSYGV